MKRNPFFQALILLSLVAFLVQPVTGYSATKSKQPNGIMVPAIDAYDTSSTGGIEVTVGASGLVNILTGNLKVGNGTPDVTLNGEDTYIEGTLEVDGAVRFDGVLTFGGTSYIDVPEIAAPASPAANVGRIYVADDGGTTKLYFKDAAGTATDLLAAGAGNTLDAAYDQGGAGAGGAVTVDSGAITLTNSAADNNGVLEITKSPVGAQSGAGLSITMGAQASGAGLSFANTGSGNDILGSGSTWSISKAGAFTGVSGTFTTLYQTAIASAAAGNQALTVDATGNGTITIGGTSTGNTIFPGVVQFNGNTTLGNAVTDTVTITGSIAANVTLDDGVTDSPSLIFKDATDQTFTIAKTDAGDLTITPSAATLNLYLASGNLKVGNGAPGTAAMDGDDAYIKGELEVDGAAQFDGAATFAGTVAINGAPTITNVEASYTTNADDQFAFSRNQGVTTKALVAITTQAAADDNAALAVTSGATGAIDAATISNAGTAAGLHITNTAAGGTALDIDVADSMTGRALYGDLGPWLGTADQGAIELVTDNAATVPAGQLLRLNQQGTGQHAGAIDGSVIYVKDDAAAPGAGTSYAVTIDATNIAALHVKTGASQFDTAATFSQTVTINEEVLVSMDANDEEVIIQSSAADYGANSAIVAIKGTAAAGQTNASYLLSLDRNADGDAQDHFLVMRDNSYTDVKFKVDSGGATTIAGLLTADGGITSTGTITLSGATIAGGATPLAFDGTTADANKTSIAITDPTAARTITLPNATGTVKLNCTATKDYGGGAADWTLDVAENQCSFITVSNASGGVNALLPSAVPGQVYLVYNGSGQTLTVKVTGQAGGTIANGKYALYAAHASDVVEVWEQP